MYLELILSTSGRRQQRCWWPWLSSSFLPTSLFTCSMWLFVFRTLFPHWTWTEHLLDVNNILPIHGWSSYIKINVAFTTYFIIIFLIAACKQINPLHFTFLIQIMFFLLVFLQVFHLPFLSFFLIEIKKFNTINQVYWFYFKTFSYC